MRIRLAFAVFCVVATTPFSSAWSESFTGGMYIAGDAGTFTAPGMDDSVDNVRIAFGVQPEQGWGAELNATSAKTTGCGCADPNAVVYIYSPPIPISRNKLHGAEAYELVATYSQPVNNWISLTGKLGAAKTDYMFYTSTLSNEVHNTATDLAGGVGLQVKLFRKIRLRFQYEMMRTANYGNGTNRLDFASMGLVIRFH